jgi:hypothetical protein
LIQFALITHSKTPKYDSVISQQYLYDNLQRKIVVNNCLYGTMRGTFVYEYDVQNRIQARRFLVRENGVVLCIDTLIYEWADSAKSKTRIRHMLRIAGRAGQISIDETIVDVFDYRKLYYYRHYVVFNKQGTSKPLGSISTLTYDSLNRKSQLVFSDSLGFTNIHQNYLYDNSGYLVAKKGIIFENDPKRGAQSFTGQEVNFIYNANGTTSMKKLIVYNYSRNTKTVRSELIVYSYYIWTNSN